MGPFRSGTSLVSAILAGLDVCFGPPAEASPPPDRYNPLGYFQRREIVSANARFIASAGGTQANPGTPEMLLKNGDWKILACTSLPWIENASSFGMKDPRFSATLWSWVHVRRFNRGRLKVIRVTRRTEAVAASVMKHREVREYCGNDFSRALAMTETYDINCAWTAKLLGVPACQIAYESLIADPRQEVSRLADYLEILDLARINRCTRLVGKRRALLDHYTRKLVHPTLLAETIAKTVKAKRPASG